MIDVIDLRKNFHDLEVLKGINFKVEKGDIVAVIGPSGSGKSTFLRCLNCMEDPTSGKIIFNGVDIADMKVDINIHRRHMGISILICLTIRLYWKILCWRQSMCAVRKQKS